MLKTALITGFETFGKYLSNPSKWLALSVDGKTIADHKIHSLVFPSTILLPKEVNNFGEMIIKTALKNKTEVILSFGMASKVKGFQIERTGVNWIKNDKYCLSYENRRPIKTNRPSREKKQINLNYWNLPAIKKLFQKARIPYDYRISDNAGRYCCNALIYQTLLAMEKNKVKIPYLFVHHSCTEQAIELVRGLPRSNKIIIKREYLSPALKIFLSSYRETP